MPDQVRPRPSFWGSIKGYLQPVKMTQVQVSVLLICVVIFALVAGISYTFTRVLDQFVFTRTIEPLIFDLRRDAEATLDEDVLLNWINETAGTHFSEFAKDVLLQPNVLRVSLFNRHGVVVWSSETGGVGMISDNKDVLTALGGSTVYHRLNASEAKNLGLPAAPVLQIFTPTFVEGVPAASEIHVDLREIEESLSTMRWYVTILAFAAILVMATFLLAVFRRLGDQIFKQSQELKTFFDHSPVGLLLVEADGKIQSVNPAMETFANGHRVIDAVGQNVFARTFYISKELNALLRAAFAGEHAERVLSHAMDGQTRWHHVRVIPLRGPLQRVERLLVLFEDVTKQKELELVLSQRATNLERGMRQKLDELRERTRELEDLNTESNRNRKALLNALQDAREFEAQLQREHDQLQTILSSIGDAVYVIDMDDQVLLMNEAAEKMFEVKAAAAIGRPVKELYRVFSGNRELIGKERPSSISRMTGQVVHVNVGDNIFVETAHGRRFPVVKVISPLVGAGTHGAVIVMRDVTIEKQVDESKTNFISIASHQLRTPLTAIRWLTELLVKETKGKLEPQYESYVDDIHTATTRMITLVNALLNVSRIESGRVKIQPKKVQFLDLVRSVIDELSLSTRASRCEIEVIKPSRPLPKIDLDVDLIRQVVQNLLTNAIRYSRPNICRIQVSLKKEGTSLVLEVEDNGIGIPQEAQARIFEKFYRAANASHSQTDGTGLGLYISKMIVDMAGGTIGFKSKEGLGTTFTVRLPLEGMKKRQGEVGLISNGN